MSGKSTKVAIQSLTAVPGFESCRYSFLRDNETSTRYMVAHPKTEIDRNVALVFIPGWGGVLEFWHHQLRYFLDCYTLIALDYPGCGESHLCNPNHESEIKPYTITEQAYLLDKIITQEAIESCFIVGHSMGGAIALQHAALHGDKVKGVIGADTFSYMDLYPKQSLESAKHFSAAMGKDYPAGIRTLAASYIADGDNHELINWVSETMSKTHKATGLMLLEELLTWDMQTCLDQYSGPVKTINAAQRYHDEEFKESFGGQIQMCLLYDSGHFVMLEQPDAFNHSLEQTLRFL